MINDIPRGTCVRLSLLLAKCQDDNYMHYMISRRSSPCLASHYRKDQSKSTHKLYNDVEKVILMMKCRPYVAVCFQQSAVLGIH